MGNKTKKAVAVCCRSPHFAASFLGKFFGQVTDSSEKNEGSQLKSPFIPHRAFF